MKRLSVLPAVILAASCSFNSAQEKPKYIIDTPYGEENLYDETITPEVYSIVAVRTTNKMLDQTTNIYETATTPTLYIMEVKKASEDMPNGFYYARKVSKDIIAGSRTFHVVNNLNDADYYIETVVDKIPLENTQVPAIKYTITLYDKDNNKINEWTEVLQQVQNGDQSWW